MMMLWKRLKMESRSDGNLSKTYVLQMTKEWLQHLKEVCKNVWMDLTERQKNVT